MEQNVVLEMRDISKNFTGVRALSHVDFTLRRGEIHALMGAIFSPRVRANTAA